MVAEGEAGGELGDLLRGGGAEGDEGGTDGGSADLVDEGAERTLALSRVAIRAALEYGVGCGGAEREG